MGATILGDDLYCKHLIRLLLDEKGSSYILRYKPNSHKTLYEYLSAFEPGKDIFTATQKIRTGTVYEFHTYKWANQLPLRDSEDTVLVNWCELSIRNKSDKIIFKNSYATNFKITEKM